MTWIAVIPYSLHVQGILTTTWQQKFCSCEERGSAALRFITCDTAFANVDGLSSNKGEYILRKRFETSSREEDLRILVAMMQDHDHPASKNKSAG
jgi:hypothetical protein